MKKQIPDFLSHLPVYRGYPVPYFVPKDNNGIFQFKFASGEKMMTCHKYKKCCVCGKNLKKGLNYFISGPLGLSNQSDSHTPMYLKCAKYSLNLCPHLFFEKTKRTTNEEDSEPWQITIKPKQFYLVLAKKYKLITTHNSMIIKYSNHRVVQEYSYKNGELHEKL